MVLKLRVEPPDNWKNAKCLGTVTGPHVEDEEAAALRDPFFEDHDTAKDFCNGVMDGVVCPIRQQCLEFALVNNCREGIWGGMGESARKSLRRRWPPENVREARLEWQYMPDEEALTGVNLEDLEVEDDDEWNKYSSDPLGGAELSEVKLSGNVKQWSDTRRRSKGYVLGAVERSFIGVTEDRRGAQYVHPSEVCKPDWCERATAQRINSGVWPVESYNLIRENIFAEGDFIHEKWQRNMARTGKLWGDWQCRICLATYTGYSTQQCDDGSFQLDSGDYCPLGDGESLAHDFDYREVALSAGILAGHEDGAIDNYLVELKSVGLGTLRMEQPELLKRFYVQTTVGKKLYDLDGVWKELKYPMISHQIQGQLYLWMAKQMGLPFDRLAIIYEYKPNQQVREFDMKPSMRLIEPILKRIDNINIALNAGTLPDCPNGGCKYCGKEDKAKSAEVRPPRGRTAKGTVDIARSASERSDNVDGAASSVGELHSSGVSGSGNSRKVRRRHS